MHSLKSFLIKLIYSVALATFLVVAAEQNASAQSGTWTDSTGDSAWSSAASWSGGTIADGTGNTADFSMVDLDPVVVNTNFPGFYRNAVNLDTPRTIGNLIFGDANTSTPGGYEVYTGSASVLTLAGGTPTITVNPLGPIDTGTLGDPTPEFIDDALVRPGLAGTAGFTKNGSGILTLVGANTGLTGPINVNAGTLRFGTGMTYTPASSTTTVANGAVLETRVDASRIKVAAGATATVRAINTATMGLGANTGGSVGISGSGTGETLNLELGNPLGTTTFFYDARADWGATTGALANLNVTGLDAVPSQLRMHINGGSFNGNNFLNTNITLNNATLLTRTNSGGNTVALGALSGNSTSSLSGGNNGTVAIYNIGNLNTNTAFAGGVTTGAGILVNKVGSGTLTLSGNLTYSTTNNANANLRGGVTRITAGTLAVSGSAAVPGGIVDGTLGNLFTTIDIRSGATFDVSGSTSTYATAALQQIIGSGTIVGNYNHSNGIIKPAEVPVASAANSNNTTATAGTLTFNNTLSFGSNGTILFDLTPNPAGTNDLLQVGGADLSGNPTVQFNFLGGTPDGTYTLINSATPLVGSASGWNVVWGGRGTPPVLTQTSNQVQVSIDPGAFESVAWNGNLSSVWDVNTTQNWINTNTSAADNYFQGDLVLFGDTHPNGVPASTTVTLNVTVTPSAVTVNNSALNYSITGSGKISGSTTFTKQGSGSLILQTANDFTGLASIQGGTVDIGGVATALGTGVLTMSGNSRLLITNPDNVTIAVTNTGLVVPTGQSATIVANGNIAAPANNPISVASGGLSGGGNLLLTTQVSGRRIDIPSGNAGFTGTVTIEPDSGAGATSMAARLNGGGSSLANATVVLNSTTLSDRATSVQTIALGALSGNSTARLHGFDGGSSATAKTWEIGALGSSTTFAGIIENSTGNTAAIATVSITKVGNGTLTLTGNNVYAGSTTINAGTLLVNGPHAPDTTNIATPNAVYAVNSGGTLGGTGTIGTPTVNIPITVNSGGTLAPGASVGTLSVQGNVTFMSGSTFGVEVDAIASTSDLLAVTGDLALNGASLSASLLAGSLPTGPHVIASYTGALMGTFTVPSGIVVDYGTGSNSQITLTINSLGISGDHNSDGIVDAADYVAWRKNPAAFGGDPAGYNSWRANFGEGGGGAGGSGSSQFGNVPEPAASALVTVMLAMGCGWRRQK